MRKKNKSGLMGVVVLLLMGISIFCLGHQEVAMASGAKLESTKFTIGIPVAGASFFPNHVAKAKGFYKDEGITETKILAFRGNAPTVQALAAGTIDVAVASLHGLINTIKSGQKFKGIWAGYTMTFFEWFTQPNKYKSMADTKGGSFGVSRYGSLTDSLTRYVLRKGGLNPEKDVKILQSGRNPTILAALQSGRLDVGILSIPWNFRATEEGMVRLMNQRDDIAPDYPTHIVYAKEDFIAKNPNLIKAYLRATGKAMDWIKANPDEAATLMSKELKFKPEHCRPTIDYIKDGWYADGRLPEDGMKVFWEITIAIGDAESPWPMSKWLDDSFLKTQDQWRK
jgi:NitT/TauT family transport system substrate-binding protein